MRNIGEVIGTTVLFIVLTVLTQIGGIVLLISSKLKDLIRWESKVKPYVVFTGVYVLATFLVVPIMAPVFGRERIVCTENIRPATYATVLLNRNYVRPLMNKVLYRVSEEVVRSGGIIIYLDANFPFFDDFPLLPHLSHDDGKKLDISLIYETVEGQLSPKQKSNSGYGAFVVPEPHEYNQINECLDAGYWQYDYPKYLTFGQKNKELVFSERGTKTLVESIVRQPEIGKIFIEPHLKNRMGVTHNKVRYHGCRAVRHDDHIHLQLK